MSTYQDKQELAQFIYKKLPGIPEDKKTWVEVSGLRKDTSNGYYGAVYTNGKGEYILVSRGTDNFANQVHDGEMHVFNEVPPEFTDAYQLAAKATAYVKEHGGTLSFDGHSLGGTISQLLAVAFGGEATTFNPYNSRNFLDLVERVDQSLVSSLTNRKNELQQQVDNGELGSQSDLDTVNQQLIQIEANNKLYDAWHGGKQYDITNYRIENDQVSGATDKPLLGETITIKYDDQIYVSYAESKTLSYQDSSNLANDGSVGVDSIALVKIVHCGQRLMNYNQAKMVIMALYTLMAMVNMSW